MVPEDPESKAPAPQPLICPVTQANLILDLDQKTPELGHQNPKSWQYSEQPLSTRSA